MERPTGHESQSPPRQSAYIMKPRSSFGLGPNSAHASDGGQRGSVIAGADAGSYINHYRPLERGRSGAGVPPSRPTLTAGAFGTSTASASAMAAGSASISSPTTEQQAGTVLAASQNFSIRSPSSRSSGFQPATAGAAMGGGGGMLAAMGANRSRNSMMPHQLNMAVVGKMKLRARQSVERVRESQGESKGSVFSSASGERKEEKGSGGVESDAK